MDEERRERENGKKNNSKCSAGDTFIFILFQIFSDGDTRMLFQCENNKNVIHIKRRIKSRFVDIKQIKTIFYFLVRSKILNSD